MLQSDHSAPKIVVEGPSLVLAAEQLAPFIGEKILHVSGNTKIGKERVLGKTILDIFSWGKLLVIQFEGFALQTHFMLYGSFLARYGRETKTGKPIWKKQPPRLALLFKKGEIQFYNCSMHYLETDAARDAFDPRIDIMSSSWDAKGALSKMAELPDEQLGDVLLDQTIFAGVGNIIKNESLFLAQLHPEQLVQTVPTLQRKKLIKVVKLYSQQFYEWRKAGVLRKHYQIYRKSFCLACGSKIIRRKTGLRNRWSFFCPNCQEDLRGS